MMKRIERPDIKALVTARRRIVLTDNQMFCSTGSSFEIWDKEPLRRVHSIQRKSVFLEIGNYPEI